MEKVLGKGTDGKTIKITSADDGEKWYALSSKVQSFVKTGINVGDSVDFKVTDDNGIEVISFISKTPITEKFTPKKIVKKVSEYTCNECGAPLKDNKYSTCYTCSMKLKKEVNNSPEEKSRQESIQRQAVAHATSRVLIALQGHIDPNNVLDIYNTVYDNILNKVENK
jgi:hypothetical protein